MKEIIWLFDFLAFEGEGENLYMFPDFLLR